MSAFLGVLMAVVALIGTSLPVRAEGTTYSITVNNSEAGHVYTSYQIFTGDLLEKTETVDGKSVTTKILSNVEKGSGLSSTSALVSALLGNSTLKNKDGIKDLTSSSSAADIAKALETANLTSNESIALGKVVNSCKTGSGTQLSQSGNVYTAAGFAPGYYLITDGKASGSETNPSDYSSLILQVLDNTQIEPKISAPQVIKKVYDGDYTGNDTVTLSGQSISLGTGYNDVTDAGIGDDVSFEIFVTLPDNYDSYDSYAFQIVDELDESLTPYVNVISDYYGPSNTLAGEITSTRSGYRDVLYENYYSVSYKNSGSSTWTSLSCGDEASAGWDFKTFVETSSSSPAKTRIFVVFPNLKNNGNITKDTVIKFTFDATLNEKAKIGNAEGNKNTVKLNYSNNPQDSKSLGETPVDTNVVFTYELDVNKISTQKDNQNKDVKLEGATFALYSYVNLNPQSSNYGAVGYDTSSGYSILYWLFASSKDSITQDSDGRIHPEYLDLGTRNAPPTATETPSYKRDIYRYGMHVFTTNSDGVIRIKGLNAGTYYLEELKAPDGYNMLTEPIKIVITPTIVNTQNYLNSTVTNKSSDTLKTQNSDVLTNLTGSVYPKKDKDGNYVADTSIAELGTPDVTQGIVPVTVKNMPGSILPSTGGRGTRMIYLIGFALITTAGAEIVMKKRRAA